MSWRLARSIEILRNEVDFVAPGRNKASDGTIGDAAHAARTSDHNPYIKDSKGVGVVRAIDITHDPEGGCDCHALAEFVRRLGETGDQRVRYVIWNRRIASSTGGWAWRPYTGSNPHDKHVHVSVSEDPRGYDSTQLWGWKGAQVKVRNEGLSDNDIKRIWDHAVNNDEDTADKAGRVLTNILKRVKALEDSVAKIPKG